MVEPKVHAFTDDVLARHDAVAIAELVRKGDVSVEEIVAAAIERCRVVNPQLAAVAEEDFDRATQRAKDNSGDASLAFYGVPTFIKDQLPVAGLTTRFGSRAFDNASPATKNAPFVQQFFDMGVVNLGTSSLPEFGLTASTEFPDAPPTRNPWNPDRSPGGSSGGAAALVASGVVPIAHGADGGGSIRIPSACNGLVGLKGSRGRIIEDPGVKHMPVRIIVDGVLTRTVRDTAMYYAEAEKRYHVRSLPKMGLVDRPLERKLRIGALIDSPTGQEVDAATRKGFEETIELLTSLGHEVERMDSPVDYGFVKDFTHYWAMMAYVIRKTGHKAFDPTFNRDALTKLTHGLADRFARDKWHTPGVIWRLRKTAKTYAKLFKKYDVFLSPVVTAVPPELGYLGMNLPYDELFPRVERWAGFTAYCNATGGPSISLPLAHDAETNCPIGMSFSAPLGQDALLLELALHLEEAKPW